MTSKSIGKELGLRFHKFGSTKSRSNMTSGNKATFCAPATAMFLILVVIVWLDELLDFPHLLLGTPHSLINWPEAVIETIVVLVLGVFTVSKLILYTNNLKQAEKKLDANREFSNSVLENAPYPVVVLNLDTSVEYVNPAFKILTGFSPDEVFGRKPPYPWWTEETMVKTTKAFENAIIRGVNHGTRLFKKKNGERFWVELSFTHRAIHGDLRYYISNWVDITPRIETEQHLLNSHSELEQKVAERTSQLRQEISQRRKNEKLLEESEAKYRAIFEHVMDGILLVDPDTARVVDGNTPACETLGYTREELKNLHISEIDALESPEETRDHINRILRNGSDSFETKHRTKDGKTINCHVNVRPIMIGNKILIQSLWQDITDKTQMEKDLIQADKMISLGILTAGMAHEINNPNNFIMLNAPILQEAWESIFPILDTYYEENGDFNTGGLPYSEMRHEIPKLFSGIEEGSKRIKRIVEDLKVFSRQDSGETEQDLDINQAIKSAIAMVKSMIKKTTRCFTAEYGKNLPRFRGKFQRIEQVMLNLIQNACQSLPDKEKGVYVTSSYKEKTREIVIEVRDEGEGIPNDVLPHIMDPFFTTRREFGGTGLGLAVSANIVKEHGGKISVDSQKGKGSSFRVTLPIMD